MSEPSECLKIITFREGCFVIHVEYKYLSEALETITSFTKDEDNTSQLDDYDAPFCEQQYTLNFVYFF